MKKKFITVFISAFTLAMAVGCSLNGDSQDVSIDMSEESENGIEVSSDSEPSAEPAADQSDATAATSVAAGETGEDIASMGGEWYGILQASAKDERGKTDDFGDVKCIVYDIAFEGDTIKVSGLLKNEKLGAYCDAVHEVKLTDSTKYEFRGGEGGPEVFDRSKFEEEVPKFIDSELGFYIEIENGVAKAVAFSS